MNDITPAVLRKWMKEKKHTQSSVADMLGTSHASVSRWLKNIHSIGAAEKKLLAYFIYGTLPFGIATKDQGWHLEFTESEFLLIQLCARREGFSSVEEWVTVKIKGYLAMMHGDTLAAEKETPYKVKKS